MAQVSSDSHFSKKYSSLERFISYFYQTHAIYDSSCKTVLIIGVGDGLVPYLLKQNKNYDVTTLDFDPNLKPDIVGDIRALPFPDKSFDMVCAFEILEHIPYVEAVSALQELSRVSKIEVVISVPHRRTGFEFVFKFPFIRSLFNRDFVRVCFRIPIRFKGFASSGQHYWEIDGHSTRLSDFRKVLKTNFRIVKESTPVLDFYRRFFYLEKL